MVVKMEVITSRLPQMESWMDEADGRCTAREMVNPKVMHKAMSVIAVNTKNSINTLYTCTDAWRYRSGVTVINNATMVMLTTSKGRSIPRHSLMSSKGEAV